MGRRSAKSSISTYFILSSALGTMLGACEHSVPFESQPPAVGPFATGKDVLLTYNADQNYWPMWTEDQSGILYAFVDASQPDAILRSHRCVGLLPAEGGMRIWQWCDSRSTERDSLNSIPAFALGADGRLIYVEATTPIAFPFGVPNTTLWLADSATPFRRRQLLKFPVVVGDSVVSWLADLQWTGPTSFVAAGERAVLAGHCPNCSQVDTVFYGEMIVSGTIGANGATLTPIAGTSGATGYSLAENGALIVFTVRDSTSVRVVSSSGGVPLRVAVTPRTEVELLGVSCRGTTCVIALAPVTLWQGLTNTFPSINRGQSELRAVSLTTGTTTTILLSDRIIASPLLAASGDVVVQVGDMFGHLQTLTDPPLPNTGLHLFKSLVQ